MRSRIARRANRRVALVTTAVLVGSLCVLMVSPLLGHLIGILLLALCFVGYNMRPPVDLAHRKRITMICQLQSMCRTSLAQHSGPEPYSPQEYRQIINAFERVKSQLSHKKEVRWRLKHFVARCEAWYQEYQKRRSQDSEKDKLDREKLYREKLRLLRSKPKQKLFFQRKQKPPEAPSKERSFNPYRADFLKRQKEKEAKRRFSKRAEIEAGMDKAAFRYAELQKVVEEAWDYLEPRPLCLEFTVTGERAIDLAITSSVLLNGATRLRYLFASTGVIVPSVTFAGSSCRMEETVGLLLREQEVGCFRLSAMGECPLPRWLAGPEAQRIEGVSSIFLDTDTEWPLQEMTKVHQSLLHLSRMISQNFPSLICREALLSDVPDPALPSKKFLALARQYVRNGRTVPRGSFLELSLQLIEGMTKQSFRLPCETRNLPGFVAVTRSPMPFFDPLRVTYLTLSLIGPRDNPYRLRVEESLSADYRERVAQYSEALGESGDSFEDYLTHLSESDDWEDNFGPPQFLLTTGHTVVERLLQSANAHRPQHMIPGVTAQLCENLARRDPRWLTISILLSHFQERSTGSKARLLARKQPARLARLLEGFGSQPEQTRYFTPLEKLKILCTSLGETGLELEAQMAQYFPPLPVVKSTPQETHQVQAEILARVRYWAVRGFADSHLETRPDRGTRYN